MLTRIFLIITLVAGLGALAISQFMVKDKIDKITSARDEAETARNTLSNDKTKLQADLGKVKNELDKTSNELTQTKRDMEVAKTETAEAQKKQGAAEAQIKVAEAETQRVKKENEDFFKLNMTIAQILKNKADLSRTTKDLETAVEERKILARQAAKQAAEIAVLTKGPDYVVQLPPGLKGKIIAVDPKWDFVVLDIGQEKGALRNGELTINREGKLVGRVKITSVQPTYSIANILKPWKKAEIIEGDAVAN